MIFAHPYYLFLLFLLVPIIAWYIWKQHTITPEIQFPFTRVFLKASKSTKIYFRHFSFVLRCLAISLIIIALARPQKTDNWSSHTTEGIDIVMTLDISSSMLAEDLRPNRLGAAKDVAVEFISGRPNDNIGLVVFSGESFTQCPITINHKELINLFSGIQSGMIEDGTAIGTGLATAVNRIKASQARSKVIILLTDGSNNRGDIDPITAAEIAKSFGICVYAIGVGTYGKAPYPFQTPYGVRYQDVDVDIDEPSLKQIASMTGGEYFRATDTKTLRSIYHEIDKMEKTKINVKEFSEKEELYHIFALMALFCIVGEILLRNTVFRSIP